MIHATSAAVSLVASMGTVYLLHRLRTRHHRVSSNSDLRLFGTCEPRTCSSAVLLSVLVGVVRAATADGADVPDLFPVHNLVIHHRSCFSSARCIVDAYSLSGPAFLLLLRCFRSGESFSTHGGDI